jgi:FkbM family methyltransferase
MNILQIGCNNCDDHVFDFVTENKKNINNFFIVDALPKCCEKAKEVYGFIESKKIFNKAIGLEDTTCRFYFPEGEEQSEHASLNKEHVLKHHHPDINFIDVECIDINNFLKDLPPIDRLYIDIEGLDVKTLLHMNDEYFNIPYIEYEFYHGQDTFNPGIMHHFLLQKFAHHGYSVNQTSEYNCVAEKNK